MKVKLPGDILTVVIRNDGPMIHCGDSPSYRSVGIGLTEGQKKALALRYTGTSNMVECYEEISKCFIEPVKNLNWRDIEVR